MKKKYYLAVINKYDEFIGLISTKTYDAKIARKELLNRAKLYGKPYGVVFVG